MKNFKVLIGLLALFLVITLAACSEQEGSTQEETDTAASETPSENAEEASGEEAAYPMTVYPTIGATESREGATTTYEEVTFDKMPERIVVFDYGFLDTLHTLGVEGIVGVAKESTLPEHLKEFESDDYSNIGTLKAPLFEDIAEMEPDVIFISGRQSTYYEELKEIAPVVFVGTVQEDYWNTFEESVNIAATMFDKETEAEDYLAKFDEAFEEVNELAENYETSLVTMYNEGNLSGFGPDSRFGYIYELYGFNPVTEDVEATEHGSNFGFEAILQFDPEVLFVIDRTAAVGGDSNIQSDMENDIIKKTAAYDNENIIYLDGALWYLGGGGLQSELAKIEEVIAELK